MIRKIFRKVFGDTSEIILASILDSKEEKEAKMKRKKFYLQFLGSGDTYFDVGANYGNRIEPIIDEGIKIIAVEPQAKCAKYLAKKYKNRVTVIPCGLGERKETQTMYVSNAHTLTSFSEDWIKATKESGRFSQSNWDQKQEVEMETLDNLIMKYGVPQFIKVDVEGYEFEVLKGLSQPVKIISFEYTIPERKNSIFDCIDRLVKIGKSNSVYFNYSIGESMEWALDEWLSEEEMRKEIGTDRFMSSEFGDIYAKTII